MAKKIKTHVITLAKKFPVVHKRAGDDTGFNMKFASKEKIHTIRTNYDLWKKKIDEVRLGKAILSVREWLERPYGSPQHLILDMGAEHNVGYQKLTVTEAGYRIGETHYYKEELIRTLAQNDGLRVCDFENWFKQVKIGDVLIIIHFTQFRY